MRKNKNTLLLFMTVLLSSCAPQLNYIGNYYQKTAIVKLYFNEKEITEDFKTIGLLNFNTVPSVISNTNFTDLILNKAKEVGADAVLITNFSNTSSNEFSEDIFTKETTIETRNRLNVEAKFLKYKN